ncbi:MAG: cytochrome P450 [Solirubrobacterales bacterium]|nr:cytochrome P450 [Solirubrobacterales bacterium]
MGPFRPIQVRDRFAEATGAAVNALIDELKPAGRAELRRAFAGPLAALIVARALGLREGEVAAVLSWYDAIVASVTSITAGAGLTRDGERAFAALSERLREVIADGRGASLLAAVAAGSELSVEQIISNAAVLLFGGIETTEGMIANAVLALLERPAQLELVRAEPALVQAAIEESLRLEPAAAVIDRYATADVQLAGAPINAGELVRVSISAANRDPAVFAAPEAFDLRRAGLRRHIAFAQGPHVCVGIHLARLEARVALSSLLTRLPGLRLDPERRSEVRGLVFRKPLELHVLWG